MLEVKIRNGKQAVHIKMEDESQDLKRDLIFKSLETIGEIGSEASPFDVNLQINEKEPLKQINAEKIQPKEHLPVSEVEKEDPLNQMIEDTLRPTRSRRLPLMRASESPAHKDENDCRAKINCPECSMDSHRYVKFGFRYTFCPGCNEKLHLKSATGKWGEEDENGNVYLAFEKYDLSKMEG
ncbi:hypothetical protein [Sediminibacillus massiliensis]|uniref:hypothetical protein n=1 Tax=Sediminibacillus massiliensis TaxID=1926277 RepID=UPI000988812C|nr:hypothetical protein [Sediminibacillus massiliensis]